jgi:hypothetical protein
MKYVILLLMVLMSVSCMKLSKNEYYIRATYEVEIVHAIIPDTVDNLTDNHIAANSKAPNGCWSNLTFQLTEDNDFEYSLRAFGLYESFGTCSEGIVYGDSVITFKPTKTGLYKFNVYKGPTEVVIDTMIVR